jgi:hypothetical protein
MGLPGSGKGGYRRFAAAASGKRKGCYRNERRDP